MRLVYLNSFMFQEIHPSLQSWIIKRIHYALVLIVILMDWNDHLLSSIINYICKLKNVEESAGMCATVCVIPIFQTDSVDSGGLKTKPVFPTTRVGGVLERRQVGWRSEIKECTVSVSLPHSYSPLSLPSPPITLSCSNVLESTCTHPESLQ